MSPIHPELASRLVSSQMRFEGAETGRCRGSSAEGDDAGQPGDDVAVGYTLSTLAAASRSSTTRVFATLRSHPGSWDAFGAYQVVSQCKRSSHHGFELGQCGREMDSPRGSASVIKLSSSFFASVTSINVEKSGI